MPVIRGNDSIKRAARREMSSGVPYSLSRRGTQQSNSSATTTRTDSFEIHDSGSRDRSTSPSSIASSSDLSSARDISPPADGTPVTRQNKGKSPFSRAESSELSSAPELSSASDQSEAESQPRRGRTSKKPRHPRHSGQFKAKGFSPADQKEAVAWFTSLAGNQQDLAKKNLKFPGNPEITWHMAKKYRAVLQPKRAHSPHSRRQAAEAYRSYLGKGVKKDEMPEHFTLLNGAQVKKSTVEKWKEILVNEDAFEPAVNRARLLLKDNPWKTVEERSFEVLKKKMGHVHTKQPKRRSDVSVIKTFTGATVLNNWMPFFHKQQLPTIESMKAATQYYAELREGGMQQPDLYVHSFNVTLENGNQKTVLGDIVQRWKGIFQTHTD